jgi:hypothetical protein
MSLAAFTNETGTHTRGTIVSGRQNGKYYDSTVNEIIYQNGFVTDVCQKPLATGSDHHRPTNWSRSVTKLLANQPSTFRRFVTEGEGDAKHVVIDLHIDDHISNYHSLGSYKVSDPGSDNARSESITKSLNKLHSNSSNWGENLGQGKKTCEEFAKIASRVAQSLLAMKRGNVRDAASKLIGLTGRHGTRSVSKSISDLWLEYNYGIKPILSDVHELQQAVHQTLEQTHGISGVGTGISTADADFLWENTFFHKSKCVNSFRTQMNGIMSNKLSYVLESAGLVNPISIAWELVPWSFAIDWFIPVGQTLQAMTAGYGLQDNGGWTTHHNSWVTELTRKVTFSGYGYGADSPGFYQDAGFGFDRFCYTSFPAPQFFADTTPYSSERALNALALVRQLA